MMSAPLPVTASVSNGSTADAAACTATSSIVCGAGGCAKARTGIGTCGCSSLRLPVRLRAPKAQTELRQMVDRCRRGRFGELQMELGQSFADD
jgi:hypothetical protein